VAISVRDLLQSSIVLPLPIFAMGRKKHLTAFESLERAARHGQRRLKRHGVNETISNIMAELQAAQWSPPDWDDDDHAITPDEWVSAEIEVDTQMSRADIWGLIGIDDDGSMACASTDDAAVSDPAMTTAPDDHGSMARTVVDRSMTTAPDDLVYVSSDDEQEGASIGVSNKRACTSSLGWHAREELQRNERIRYQGDVQTSLKAAPWRLNSRSIASSSHGTGQDTSIGVLRWWNQYTASSSSDTVPDEEYSTQQPPQLYGSTVVEGVCLSIEVGQFVEQPMEESHHVVLVRILNVISVERQVDYRMRTWQTDIPHYGIHTFVWVQFQDWAEQCSTLSAEWKTSWHGALSPYILNIVGVSALKPATVQGAGPVPGLYHSNHNGLEYPFKYAYPSPLTCSSYSDGFAPKTLEAIHPDIALYHSLIEIRVNPMTRCKGRRWHLTQNECIESQIRLSAALFCKYNGPRTQHGAINKRGHICMTNGVARDAR